MSTKTKAVGAVVVSMALAGSATAVALPAIMGPDTETTPTNAEATTTQAAYSDVVNVANVQGEFNFSQDATTANADIANMFNKAAAAVCASMPDYDVAAIDKAIHVGGNVANEVVGTVDDLAEAGETVTYVLACACASNMPGGGAIANAEVEGVALESVVQTAGVK